MLTAVKKIITAIIITVLLAAAAILVITQMTANKELVIHEDADIEAAADVADDAAAMEDAAFEEDTRYVTITIAGSSFLPIIELAAGSEATVSWYVEETSALLEGINPTFLFETVAVRHVRLSALNPDGTDALGDIVTFNIGFDHTQDEGRYNVGSEYDYTMQNVTGIENVAYMTGLVRFLAATPTLTGALDFTGMSALEYIECFGAQVTSVDLTGCTSLIRLCMENNDLSALDLNPVSDCLYDLRMSGNQDVVTLAPLNSPMSKLYHYCAHSQTVINHPTAEQLPVIEELWDWNSGQSGAFELRSDSLKSFVTSSNAWTSIDLAYQFPAGTDGYFEAFYCQLTAINLTGCEGLIYIDLSQNLFDTEAVDEILAEVASWQSYGVTVNLSGNAAPSEDALDHIAALEERNWTVLVESE